MKPATPRHALHWAHLLHRASGVALAVFLPIHLWILSLALTRPEAFARAIALADQPLVKLAEAGLVGLLTLHLLGGLRIMLLETFVWSSKQKTLFTAGCVGSAALAVLFIVSATR
ncbi:MAG: succinate dehydrogenase, cytochrome b556 subunit [Pseudomonadota bacterium]